MIINLFLSIVYYGEVSRQDQTSHLLGRSEQEEVIFFTNAFADDERLDISPMMVAELYHNRWQNELFFKWLKQHLKIKKFWGNTENAVRIQIYSAITAYCMMAIVQKKMKIERSIYEMLQLASVSFTEMPIAG